MNTRPQTKTEKTHDPLAVIVLWDDIIDWLFTHTEKFPKSVRHSMTNRIENLVLDIGVLLIDAQYSKSEDKELVLKRINLHLEKLRFLIRLAHKRGYLSHKAYEYASKEMYRAGQMIGGWFRSIVKKNAKSNETNKQSV